MKTKINDWGPETRSLLRRLIKHGCKLVGGDNGEYRFDYKSEAQIVADLTACDESTLCVEIDDAKYLLWLVYGNEPGVLVSDYNVCQTLNDVTDEHYREWEGQTQPTKYEDR